MTGVLFGRVKLFTGMAPSAVRAAQRGAFGNDSISRAGCPNFRYRVCSRLSARRLIRLPAAESSTHRVLLIAMVAAVSLSGCDVSPQRGEPRGTSPPASTIAPPPGTATFSAGPATPAPRTRKWIDLTAGDCLADPPPDDPATVEVVIVDCANAHQAEVYSRVPVPVNAAIADVADRECHARLTDYTGQSAPSAGFTISYLIDSNQDRTSDNPEPSTIICLLRSTYRTPLTGSAHQ